MADDERQRYSAGALVPNIPSVMEVLSAQSVQLFASPWTGVLQAPLSMEFSRQEHCSGLPFPSPGDRPDTGIGPASRVSCIGRRALYHRCSVMSNSLWPHGL